MAVFIVFYDIFVELCKKKCVTQSGAVQSVGLNRAAITKWKNGSDPNGSTLSKLADYFDVTVDYLLSNGRTEKASGLEAEGLSKKQKYLIDAIFLVCRTSRLRRCLQ